MTPKVETMWGIGAILGASALTTAANYFSGKANLDWQKKAQRTTWQREDNAVQRRAADLEAAGLSKNLAAGSAAQASGPIRTEAPQINSDIPMLAMNLMRQKADISKTEAETQYIKQQGALALANTASQIQENKYRESLNPLSIQLAMQNVKLAGLEQSLKMADARIKQLGISNEEINLVKNEIEKKYAEQYRLKFAELDAIAKKVAIGIEQTKQEESLHDFNLVKGTGLPSSARNSSTFVLGSALADLIGKAKRFQFGETNRGNVPPWAEDAIKNRR